MYSLGSHMKLDVNLTSNIAECRRDTRTALDSKEMIFCSSHENALTEDYIDCISMIKIAEDRDM